MKTTNHKIIPASTRENAWRRLWPLPAALMFLILGACIPTLHPLFTEKEVVHDPALIGTWVEDEDKNSKETWTFEKGEGKEYRLTVKGDGRDGRLVAHLVQLGKYRFLDLQAADNALEGVELNGTVAVSLIRGHLLFVVDQLEPKLKVRLFGGEGLVEMLKQKPEALAHIRYPEGGLAITATTRELQKFLVQHLETPKVFSEPGTRSKAGPKS